MRDPFTVLGVDDAADDAEIRRRYLALVRDFPPDRAPERSANTVRHTRRSATSANGWR